MKKNYPVIEVPASGKPDWYEGAFSLFVVYSKHNGNFILKGYRGEVEKYLKKNYTHYFYCCSMWCNGKCRENWHFWLDNVNIFKPFKTSRLRKMTHTDRKFCVYKSADFKSQLSYKRMPNHWIPEFDMF